MPRLDREAYEHDMVEIGPIVGSIQAISDIPQKRKKKIAFGFQLPQHSERDPRPRKGTNKHGSGARKPSGNGV